MTIRARGMQIMPTQFPSAETSRLPCPRCGLLLKGQPHTLEDCIHELKQVHNHATRALNKLQALLRAFTLDPRVLKRMDQVVAQALLEIEKALAPIEEIEESDKEHP